MILGTQTLEIILNASILGFGSAIGSVIGNFLLTRYVLRHFTQKKKRKVKT